VLACALLALVVLAAPAAGNTPLPDVDVTLVLSVQDTLGWLALHNDVLGTPADSRKALTVGIAAGIGGTRSIPVVSPAFQAHIRLTGRDQALVVVITGRIPGAKALTGLTAFQGAVLEAQAGLIDNHVSLLYGLSSVNGQLLELYLTRP
jgi:hypothetical protein